ncbi:hypothetical protein INT43_003888 [Umbelopsis isabellina]|uniref:Uncharacterized protein n=1 Tax=Mortierella isabellina TaxID=91625 RepID=A0A8H7PUF1_MORIS|nr:hypothetical protein INT43_003888 [Umbelopsis isabellina]
MARSQDFLPLHSRSGNLSLSHYARLLTSRRNLVKAVAAIAFITIFMFLTRSSPKDSNSVLPDPAISPDEITNPPIVKPTWSKDSLGTDILNRQSIFTPQMFTPDQLKHNGLKPVTAVLLGWKRFESLKFIIQYLTRYPFIKEIIIWNNNVETRLNIMDFDLDVSKSMHVEIKVFNSYENLHDTAKYTTCSMATYDYCYFQDDDWLNLYMDSMYTNFMRYPDLIHSNTMPIIHLEHKRWQFTNTEINMHSGFTWLGCGSFAPRWKIQNFLAQLGSAGLGKDRLRLADMYFSIWTNQYPWQLSNPLSPLDQNEGWSDSVDQWSIVYQNVYDAASRLYSALEANAVLTRNDYFMRDEEEPKFEDRDVRAPCHNDKCLFITSMEPFPNPDIVQFDNVNITHVKDQEAAFNALEFPSNDFWDKHAYHKAVDGDSTTCWNTYKAPMVGDNVGIRLVRKLKANTFTITLSKESKFLEQALAISAIGVANEEWIPCQSQLTHSNHNNQLTFNFNCPSTEAGIKGIRASFTKDLSEPIDICGFLLDDFAV